MAVEFVFNPLERYSIEHIIMDYNGTIAIDGKLIPGVTDYLKKLKEKYMLHVITADTFKEVEEQIKDYGVKLTIIKDGYERQQKLLYLEQLGKDKCITIGNGSNDVLMLSKAVISIAVIQNEGISLEALQSAKIICTSIFDAFELCLNPLRIIATLRK
ncbi:MAG: HAD hydrolase family protein [Bacteroidales bacterium]|nr:HAD hydrolase family protein [Bacteroidales bacterium]